MPLPECPSKEALTPPLGGELSADVNEHVRTCQRCSTLLGRPMSPNETPTSEVGRPAPLPEPDLHPAGTRLGRFTVLQPLGQGGMGVVLLAHDPQLDRKVALKLLRSEGVADPTARARLLREAQAMARLSHPNVVTIFEVGSTDRDVFIAMELVEGSTLKAWLKERPRSQRDVLAVFLQAGRGLAAAHGAGFVHRDFKPDNVLISRDGRVRVTDFGVAREVGASDELPSARAVTQAPSSSLPSALTQDGLVVGTLAYMSPEQVRGLPLDARSDLFSFCLALYEALYGERPFGKPGDAVVKEPPASSTVPSWLREVLLKGLSAERDLRYPHMGALLEALTNDPTRGRRVALAIAAGLVLGAAVLSGAVLLARRTAQSPCESLEATLGSVWNDEARRDIEVAFRATGDPEAQTRWAFAEKSIDRQASAWLDAGKAACAETHVSHTESETGLRLRLDCLDLKLKNLAITLQLLAQADAQLVNAAVSVVSELPSVQACADSHVLGVVVPPAAEHRAAIDALRTRQMRTEVKAHQGERKAAIADLSAMLTEVRRLQYPPLEAELMLSLAMTQADDGDFATARATFEQTIDVAERNHLDQTAAAAASEFLPCAALSGMRSDKLDPLIEPTMRIIRRAGESDQVRLKIEHALAVVYLDTGRSEQALPHSRQAVELARRVMGPDSLRLIIELNNLGAVCDNVGLYDEALLAWREALAVEQRVLGRAANGVIWGNIALTTAKLGDLAQAKEPARQFIEISSRSGDNIYTAVAEGLLANALLTEGDRAGGERRLDRSLELLKHLRMGDTPEGAEVRRQAIEASVRLGRHQQAAALAESLLTFEATRLEASSQEWVPDLRAAGAAFLADGQPAKARTALERALTVANGHPTYPGWVGEMKFHLAQALMAAQPDVARAKQLSDEAEAELAALPTRKASYEALVQWREQAFPRPKDR